MRACVHYFDPDADETSVGGCKLLLLLLICREWLAAICPDVEVMFSLLPSLVGELGATRELILGPRMEVAGGSAGGIGDTERPPAFAIRAALRANRSFERGLRLMTR